MNNYYFKYEKVQSLIQDIKKELIKNEKTLKKAFNLDFKEWEFNVDFSKIIKLIDEFMKVKNYFPKLSKEEIIDGIGKVVCISNQNPYLILNFILSCIYTNNKAEIVLERKLLASNKAIIESIIKVIKDKNLDEDTISYLEVENKEEIIYKQDNYDLLYYFGNKEEYINFIKRINIDTKFENYGEIYVYIDDNSFKDICIDVDKFANINEIKIKYFNTNLSNDLIQINKKNNIC